MNDLSIFWRSLLCNIEFYNVLYLCAYMTCKKFTATDPASLLCLTRKPWPSPNQNGMLWLYPLFTEWISWTSWLWIHHPVTFHQRPCWKKICWIKLKLSSTPIVPFKRILIPKKCIIEIHTKSTHTMRVCSFSLKSLCFQVNWVVFKTPLLCHTG